MYQPAKWVKQLDNFHIAALCNTNVGSSTPSISNIYAAPSLTSVPVKPLPGWLLDLLTGSPSTYTLVQQEAGDLYDWGITPDIDCFQIAHNQMVDCYKQADSYNAQAEAHFHTKANIQSQLELAKIADDLHQLKGLSDHCTLNEGNIIQSRWKKPDGARGHAI
jgi:hypothetical protein